MEMKSLRDLLLRKSVGNNSLTEFVLSVDEDEISAYVLESLEKMSQLKGSRPNSPVAIYGANMDDTDIMELRDALSHHLSHYKSALKAYHNAPEGSPDKRHMQEVADKHLNHLIPLMDLAATAGPNSNGKMKFKYPEKLPAWESNYTTLRRNTDGNGRFALDPKGLNVRPAKGARPWSPTHPTGTGIPDYHYLEMPPHPHHRLTESMPYRGGFPWEEMQLGTPEEVNQGQGYMHIDDVPDKKEYTPHPFDAHPIRDVQKIQGSHFSPERLDEFENQLNTWKDSPHHQQWMQSQEEAYNKDPDAYGQRGKMKPSHLYEGMPLREQPGHIHIHTDPDRKRSSAATLPAVPEKVTPPAGVVVRRQAKPEALNVNALPENLRHLAPASPAKTPVAAAATPAAPVDDARAAQYNHYKSLPDSHPLKAIYHGNPDFMNYLKSRESK
jgi:hypothetical protein